MKTAIRDDSPVVIFEDKMMYRIKGPVPAEDYTIPFGVAEIKRAGTDITIVGTSSMVGVALGAPSCWRRSASGRSDRPAHDLSPGQADADRLGQEDLARHRGRRGLRALRPTAEIASVIADGAFYYLDAPVKRIGAMDVPVPFSPVLEDITVPSEKSVFEAAKALCGKA